MNKTRKKINQRVCYNRIWSWSPMLCEKHGPQASVTTKTSAFGLSFCLPSPSGHVFHTAWETMIKSYNKSHSGEPSLLLFPPFWLMLWILNSEHMVAKTKWLPFYKQHLQMHFCSLIPEIDDILIHNFWQKYYCIICNFSWSFYS